MNYKLPVSLIFFASLAACGGGGDSASVVSPDPTVQISSDNAMQVAKVAYQSSIDTQGLSDAGNGGFFILATDGGIAKLGDVASKADGANASGGSSVPIPAEEVPCAVDGTQTVSGAIADPLTPTLTAGDYFVVEYFRCNEGLGAITDGTTRMDVIAFNGDLTSELVSMTLKLTLTNMQVTPLEEQVQLPPMTTHGDVTVSIDTEQSPFISTGIRGNSIATFMSASSRTLTNYATNLSVDTGLFPSPYTTSSRGTLDSTELDGVIRFSNPVAFEGLGSDYPSTGEFLVEGDGSSLRLVAEDNVFVRIEIDLGADGSIDETINTTWAELAAT